MSTHESTDVPGVVQAALSRNDTALTRAHAVCAETNGAKARKMGRVAELYEREARWWGVLERWTYLESDLPTAFGRAGVAARTDAEQQVRFYRDLETDYWRRALRVASDSGVAA